MPKLSDLRNARHVRAEDLRDPEIRAEYERTALAHAVAMRVLKYRTDHGLSQSALGRELGMAQPAIARLEAGSHEPSLATLARLARPQPLGCERPHDKPSLTVQPPGPLGGSCDGVNMSGGAARRRPPSSTATVQVSAPRPTGGRGRRAGRWPDRRPRPRNPGSISAAATPSAGHSRPGLSDPL
jgi:DNA-binding XRE family transcriptional regulator